MTHAGRTLAGRIGVLAASDRSAGGLYQHSERVLEALGVLGRRDSLDLVVWAQSAADASRFQSRGWSTVVAGGPAPAARVRASVQGVLPSRVADVLRDWRLRHLAPPDPAAQVLLQADLRSTLRAAGVDAVLCSHPSLDVVACGLPYAAAIHDLQHRLQPRFPEVSAGGEWERREYLFGNLVAGASVIMVDSEVGREDVLQSYGDRITADRVMVVPFVPPPALKQPVTDAERRSLRERYHLPDRFLFYPAQLWPHKNHERIIEAIAILADRGTAVSIVLVGSASGKLRRRTLESVMGRAEGLGVGEALRWLDYVSDREVAILYDEAVALCMPTFFGPTNIPILEAWQASCPVITSAIRGVANQAGDAALLVDPNDPEAIATAVEQIWTDDELREQLARRGHQRLATYTFEDFVDRLARVIERLVGSIGNDETR